MWWCVSADDVVGNGWELKRGSDGGDENGVDGADGTGVICNKECCFFRQYRQWVDLHCSKMCPSRK